MTLAPALSIIDVAFLIYVGYVWTTSETPLVVRMSASMVAAPSALLIISCETFVSSPPSRAFRG